MLLSSAVFTRMIDKNLKKTEFLFLSKIGWVKIKKQKRSCRQTVSRDELYGVICERECPQQIWGKKTLACCGSFPLPPPFSSLCSLSCILTKFPVTPTGPQNVIYIYTVHHQNTAAAWQACTGGRAYCGNRPPTVSEHKKSCVLLQWYYILYI